MRDFDEGAFGRAFAELVSAHRWQEEPEYYPRYATRYQAILSRFAERAPSRRLDVLDIGGGQFAFLAAALWTDRACVADVDDSGFAGLRALGVDTFQWNLALDDPPTDRRFDAIFFSEVLAHLPVPGHIALRRLRTLLRPGGLLLCSTPNLFRLRNIVYLLRNTWPGNCNARASSSIRWSCATSHTCRTSGETECCTRSAHRCGAFHAIGTTCWQSQPRRSVSRRRTRAGRRAAPPTRPLPT
jgi:2-polyprenyl-3-methyl-5-hydroxy-6-metoxy-1,4-benzoquinol methylase